MKVLIKVAVPVCAVLASVTSSAQSPVTDSSPTRAEVKAQLAQIERAGFNPAVASDPYYPADMQAAEARTHGRNAAYDGTANSQQSGGLMSGNATNVDYVPVQ